MALSLLVFIDACCFYIDERGLHQYQEGLEKGIEKANFESARRMKADNMPIELISKYTGLTVEEIEAL